MITSVYPLQVYVHVSDIKQTGFLSGPFVAVPHAQVGILHGHRKASEGDHLPTMLDVQVM